MNNKVENRYSIHDFDKVWRIIPMNRHNKELIKNIWFECEIVDNFHVFVDKILKSTN